MSKNLPEQPNSEEVDLGQLFKLIGNTFNRFFNFLGTILNGMFLAFVWLVFFLKKHAIKIIIAAILGFGFGYLKEKLSSPIYQSSIIVKQNYNTGKNLYKTIDYYNNLIDEGDSLTLKSLLGITSKLANSLKSIEINPSMTETQIIKNYDYYRKGLDSTFASTIDYNTYFESIDLYEYQEQEITINVDSKINVNPIFDKIVNNINQSPYFKRENEKDLNELKNRESALKQALVKSDTLQNMYKRVLEMPLDQASGTQTSITIEGSDKTDKTKEFELYKSEIELRKELVEIERDKENREHILEVVSNRQDSAITNNKVEVFNKSISFKMFFPIAFVLILVLTLLFLNFIKYLERFKDKI